MGQRDGFSNNDIQKIRKMYNCRGTSGIIGNPQPTSKPTGGNGKPPIWPGFGLSNRPNAGSNNLIGNWANIGAAIVGGIGNIIGALADDEILGASDTPIIQVDPIADDEAEKLMGQRERFALSDIAKINNMYNCAGNMGSRPPYPPPCGPWCNNPGPFGRPPLVPGGFGPPLHPPPYPGFNYYG